jgi:rfaE bifunctional protein nucleotidyltransferase chain/domain
MLILSNHFAAWYFTRMWNPRQKLVDWPTLLLARETARRDGGVVVWTNGCFDLLHPGHVASLRAARQFGDLLIVGVNSDTSVQRNKGPMRPILTQHERSAMLAALECVDYVIVFDEPTPEFALAKLQPDIHCKGAEYAPPNGRPVPERAVVEGYGGTIRYIPLLPGVSTTELIARIHAKTEVSRAA